MNEPKRNPYANPKIPILLLNIITNKTLTTDEIIGTSAGRINLCSI